MRIPPSLERLGRPLARFWPERALLLKAVSFALIGVVNATIDFGVFSLGFFYFGLPIIAANAIAWVTAVSNSYVLNSTITFAAETGRKLSVGAYLAFALSQAGGLIANTTTVVIASYFVPVLLAKVLAIGASFVVDFTLSHLVVFRRRESTPPAEGRG
jgi:putative flippase GtrA